ncbi:MAG: class E sortase [Ornithinibacter sp.]
MRLVRACVGAAGELAISLAVFLFAFVAWQLWWTDLEAGRAQAQTVTRIERDFAVPPVQGAATAAPPPAEARVHLRIPLGDAFALIRVPRFGSTFIRPVLEGTTRNILAEGVGHYIGTALPGEVGNFATAGHRTTYAKPYSDIDTLRTGDVIVIETRTAYHVYSVMSHEIVLPSAIEVIEPVPGKPGARPVVAVMTMTSCNPRYSAAQRYVVHAALKATYSRAEGLPVSVLAPPKGA